MNVRRREVALRIGLVYAELEVQYQLTWLSLYSVRRASTGFTDAARRAGTKLAIAAAIPSIMATATSVGASQELTPNSSFRANVAAVTEPTAPSPMPNAANPPASFKIIW